MAAVPQVQRCTSAQRRPQRLDLVAHWHEKRGAWQTFGYEVNNEAVRQDTQGGRCNIMGQCECEHEKAC